jgi:hypothetical protein
MEALIAVHELVECMLCKSDGIDQVTVDKFDMEFEKDRAVGNEDEPGDDPHAPYHGQHCFATGVERLLAATIGVKWNDYADEIEKLP